MYFPFRDERADGRAESSPLLAMKPAIVKSALVVAALAALVAGVDARQSVRLRAQKSAIDSQAFGFARSSGGGTTGGSGGIITGPAPRSLSPFEVFFPAP